MKREKSKTQKMTVAELEKWANEHREQYHAGTLPEWKRKRLEETPGWTWEPKEEATHA